MQTTNIIQIENLVKRYQNLVALDHLSLTIHEGEIFGHRLPNGSGKTTAINCLLALLKYDKGAITIFGKNMHPNSYDIKKQIGVVMQNVAVFEQMSVWENIDYFCGLYVKDKTRRKQLVEEAVRFNCRQLDWRTSPRCAQRNSPAAFCGGSISPAASSTSLG